MIALILLLALIVITFVVVAVTVTVFAPPPTGATVDRFVVAHHLGEDADSRRAIARYIGRTNVFARCGVVLGVLSAVVLGAAWYQQITAGYGASPLGDLFTMGLVGWFIGLLLSARYWTASAPDGPRTAPLTPRDPDRYRSAALARAMAVVAGSSALLGGAALLPGAPSGRWAVAALGLLSVTALAWAARTQGRIAHRPQPFVTANLLATDEVMRVTSAQVIGLAAVGVGLVVIGWQATLLVGATAVGANAGWTTVLPLVPLVAGCVVAGRARRLIHPKASVVPSTATV